MTPPSTVTEVLNAAGGGESDVQAAVERVRAELNDLRRPFDNVVTADAADLRTILSELSRLSTVNAEMEGALEGLENASDDVCAGRTTQTYLMMVADGQEPALEALDDARRTARTALATAQRAKEEGQ